MAQNPQNLPPYRRIAEEIIERIKSGELQPGDRLPSVRDIVKSEGISSATAARVPSYLRAEGWAIATPGVGTIVAEPKKIRAGADRLQMLRAGGTGLDDGDQVEFLDAERCSATQEVADALGLDEGAEVARRRRLYRDSRGGVTVSTTWVARAIADAAPAFLESAPLPKMTFGLIEEHTGRRAIRRRDTVENRPVPEDVAELLGVPADTPVLTVVNHYWDQNGEPTEYAVDYHGAGRTLTAEYDLD